MSEDGGRKSEVGCQRTEVGEKSEGRVESQKSDVGDQRSSGVAVLS
jgi:hypothetical protein